MTKGYKTKESTYLEQLEKKRKRVAADLQREIDERKASLDSPSSSSTSSSSTTESTEYSISQDEDSENTLNILDTLYDTVDSSTDEEAIEEEQETLAHDKIFFENFGELPDITNISEDISVCTIVEEKEVIPKDTTKDMGHFVNPLTGSEFHMHVGSFSLSQDNSKASSVASEDTVSESQQSELSENLLPDDILFAETQPTSYDKEEDETTNVLFETFLQLETTKVEQIVDDIDWEAIAKQQEDKLILENTLEFINDIIQRVVEIAERISPEVILRQNLDKRKLLSEISQVHQQYVIELKVSDWLNQKVVEYFKRKKIFRPIIPENIKTLPQEKEKYINAVRRLDELLAKAADDSTTCKVKRIRTELENAKQKVNTEVLMFESLVKMNLVRETSPQWNTLIDLLLRRMAKYRTEVSEVRYRMITRQDTHALLLEKLTKLEDLGNGLTIKDYDHIQTENQALGKKIEERNIDLKKLYLRSQNCLHLLAHFREKKSILCNVMATQRSALYEFYEERRSLRKYIYELKLKRSRLRQEINELSIRGGLIDKPALMYDYDQTMERLRELREIVNRLRITLDTIQQRIQKLEKRLTQTNHNFSMINFPKKNQNSTKMPSIDRKMREKRSKNAKKTKTEIPLTKSNVELESSKSKAKNLTVEFNNRSDFNRTSDLKAKTNLESLTNANKTIDSQRLMVLKKNQLLNKFINNELLEKVVSEIDSIGSSSESEEILEIIVEEEPQDFNALDDPEKFLQLETFFEEDILSDEELDHIKENKFEKELFEMFENVPEIDDLSLAPTDDLVIKYPIILEIDPTNAKDTGKFVNPLTGTKSSSSASLSTITKEDEEHHSTEESELEETETEEKISQKNKSDNSIGDLVESADEFDDVPKQAKTYDDEDLLEKFFEKDQEIEIKDLDEYHEAKVALMRKEQERLILQHTSDFLNKLIDHCVAKSEYIDANVILRKNLDKRKLLEEIKSKYELLEVERRAMRFLNRKCVEHFKRKCSFRLITADDPKTFSNDSKNYYNALDNLDKLLITEEKTKGLCSAQVMETREQFKEMKQRSKMEVNRLEQLIKTTFQRENSEKLKILSLSKQLEKMAAIRKEISDVRFRLLLKQHDVSELGQERKILENLGNDMQLTQYETMETETNVLSKKLEERNSALMRLHKHYNSDLHNMAHLKEKQKMLRHIVSEKKKYLKKLQIQKNTCRTFMSELKIKRQKLRSDIRNVSFQSGLLDKPILMRDYDETEEKANKLRQTIDDLKNTIEALTTKISVLEKKV
ncbi:DNA repair protein rad50 [Lucilia cuprina]|uniref:DNA repair protein rad50 n=1 Tax=Lucilia cuprina TaxID=7375 RepID=UPI001F063583|nr:DNA repair protein rad50 [Lucilia cuprina]